MMAFLDYDEVRTLMDSTIRGFTGDTRAALASAGIPTVTSGDYETVDFSSGDVALTPTLVGTAFAPAADADNPQNGPDPAKADTTLLAVLVTAIVEHTNAKYDSELKAKLNPLIEDYNSRFGTSFSTLG
jgi:hypothetical protein